MLINLTRNLLANGQFNRFAKTTACSALSINKRYMSGSYEGDGKTKVNILNNDLELGLMINTYSQFGFRLNNGLKVVGPMAIFPKTVLSWNVSSFEDINEESLSLFCILEPKIDVLVLGIGDVKVTPKIHLQIFTFMKKYRINVEILPTEQACSTFNFLNAEQRLIAGAFIPPQMLSINEDDLMSAQRRNDPNYTREEFI